jgi:hypothetical protein
MIYLLDANILITAANTYYGISRVPEFWSWLTASGIVWARKDSARDVRRGSRGTQGGRRVA